MSSNLTKTITAIVGLVALGGIYLASIYFGFLGNLERDGQISPLARPADTVRPRR